VSDVDKVVSPLSPAVDFSQFAVGQQYEASLLSIKKFGAFVDIGKGVNVLLPRSLLSNNAIQKLQKAMDEKSQEKISIELVGVSAENRTLSGKFAGDKTGKRDYRSKASVSLSKDLESKSFNATIVSIHDFGVFASIDELGADGLIPMSKLAYGTTKANVRDLYT
jgi:ribosomal protein S1